MARGVTRLKGKEFELHRQNLETVGTRSAILAGFAVTVLVKFHSHTPVSRYLLFGLHTSAMLTLGANVLNIATTSLLAVFGTSLSTRGSDGSMVRAVDAIYSLRRSVFLINWVGVVATMTTVLFYAWISLDLAYAAVATAVVVGAFVFLTRSKALITRLFYFEKTAAVGFADLRRLAGDHRA